MFRSLERLQCDSIDLLQLHDMEYADPDTIFSEAIPALLKLKEQGLIRAIGFTG